jgi:hypothetical protein
MFYAAQGQLSTFMVAWFGQAQNIAEVAALGRLGQLFAFLSALFGMLVMPHFARVPDERFVRQYAWAVAFTLGLTAGFSAAAFAVPQPLLWLLGSRYDHLLQEVGWVVLAGAMGFAGGAIWSIHSARKWVFWGGSAFYIAGVVLVQAAFLAWVDLSSTFNVVMMGVGTSAVALVAQAPIGWMGLRRDAQRLAGGPALPAIVRDGPK